MKNVPGGNIYQGMIIDSLADTISRSNQIGISQVFERELLKFKHGKKDIEAVGDEGKKVFDQKPDWARVSRSAKPQQGNLSPSTAPKANSVDQEQGPATVVL